MNRENTIVSLLATGLFVSLFMFTALPAPVSVYSVSGVTLSDDESSEPLAGIKFELSVLDEADQISQYYVNSNSDGEFAFEKLLRNHSYRIRPLSEEYSFKPEEIVLSKHDLSRLPFSEASLEGFKFLALKE